MSLPRPHCSFTIPSIHDDVELNCRIYYPRPRTERNSSRGVLGQAGFAILAHPYAPLGGCYDDPVVALAGGVLLQAGYFLITFNFRGASGSAGRTSWTGKPELSDYVSVYGFLVCYIDAIFHGRPPGEDDVPPAAARRPPVLILGGYSYGAMIASHLPALGVVIDLFRSPTSGSAESEIRRRALDLSRDAQAYLEMHSGSATTLTTPRVRSAAGAGESARKPSPGVVMGGYESDAASRRVSRENSRRSMDGERIRRSVDRIRRKIGSSQPSSPTAPATTKAPAMEESAPVLPEVAYVIISPILSMAAGFTTMFSKLRFTRKDRDTNPSPGAEFHELTTHPCCCCYGTRDGFTSASKLQRWTQDLQSQPGSRFVAVSADTGHFWHEADGAARLRQGLAEFLETLGSHNLPPDTVEVGETVEAGCSSLKKLPRASEDAAARPAAGEVLGG
ncbi:uncharacterized protein Z520_10374 [Fonsecaea multimorphosa CBS 102226]|uniref:AB hydrolase-1 domain-containing protein n=1 Tax=Fonsecaea multimorphosa CBS 102226 TaxID=1442371 RepID=A0A0D2JL85_9EURO|nr:uncharacterized protein Z520_10374 [Fonsecaea multimorphosa CBS 102226]KIX94037.1 hypothetical protein Z520_10374 [Fonsecaea multimorphosa CBS 102226]OAL19383.1 hypothetical protein AYO22_09927 [Fonsecaea multimorphosa]